MPPDDTIATTSRKVGEYLVCDPAVIDAVLAEQLRTAENGELRRIGELLLDAEAISLDNLLDAIRAQRVDRLRACHLFSSLSQPQLEELSAVFQEVTVDGGEQFIDQDERDPCLYILASGALKVLRVDDNGEEIPLARVFPGEPVGEMGYFADGIRSASVRALEPCELLRASYDDLSDCFESVPAVASAFLEVVTNRLRNTNVLYQENQFRRGSADSALGHLDDYIDLTAARELEAGIGDLLVRLVHAASRLTDADRASLFLLDPETGELWSKVAQGAEVKEIRVPVNTGIVGWVMRHGGLVNIEDAYEDDRFNPAVDKRTGYRTRTVLCTPVRGMNRQPVGALQVINKEIGLFTEEDESLLRAVAAQASVAIENINVFRKVLHGHQRLIVLLDVATALAAHTGLDAATSEVTDRIQRIMRCDRCRFLVLEDDGENAWYMRVDDDSGTRVAVVASDTAASLVTATGAAVVIADAYEDERFKAVFDSDADTRTRNLLAVPVHAADGRVAAVIECVNRPDGIFENDDAETLKALAAQIGVSSFFA